MSDQADITGQIAAAGRAVLGNDLFLPSQAEYLDYTDDDGLDPAVYFDPNCPRRCEKGILTVEDGGALPRQQLCPCVQEGQRRHTCEVQILNLFGKGGARNTFARYEAGANDENQAALKACKNYVASFPAFYKEGIGFGLYGKPGAGKTHLAKATLIALIKHYTRTDRPLGVFCLSVPEIMDQRRRRFDDKSLEDPILQAQAADICLLDDIATERHVRNEEGLTFVQEQLYLILNHRLTHSLPTIFTTNMKTGDMSRFLDERVARRLMERTAMVLEVHPNPKAGKPPVEFTKLLLS